VNGLPATLPELRQFLRENLAAGRREHFGSVRESWTAIAEDYFWDEKHQNWRLDVLTRHGVQPGRHRVLDLSSGCGQFVLFALQRGYKCEGLEPGGWRRVFVERKIDLSGYPAEWKASFHEGFGEDLPFENDTRGILRLGGFFGSGFRSCFAFSGSRGNERDHRRSKNVRGGRVKKDSGPHLHF
jgi:hypothetical protein